MIKLLTLLTIIIILLSPWFLQREANRLELESAFNECMQDLDWQECSAGIYE